MKIVFMLLFNKVSMLQVRICSLGFYTRCIYRPVTLVGVRSTVVEGATYMRVYAGSSPTSADHRKELI